MIVKIVTLCVKKAKMVGNVNAQDFLDTLEYLTLAVQRLDTESDLKS